MPARRVLPLVAVAVLLAGCDNEAAINKNPHSGVGTASASGGVQQIVVRTGSDYRFHPSTITVHPGRVRIILVNTEQHGAPHNLQVPQFPGDDVPLAAAGETQQSTFTAPAPGRYRIECSIHIAQGQTGTLVVLAH